MVRWYLGNEDLRSKTWFLETLAVDLDATPLVVGHSWLINKRLVFFYIVHHFCEFCKILIILI